MKRLTAFCFLFFCCNPKIVSIFAPAMAKCIFYILLGLFLISKFTSVSDDMEGCKTLPTADVHYFSGTRYNLSGADGRQCQGKRGGRELQLPGRCRLHRKYLLIAACLLLEIIEA